MKVDVGMRRQPDLALFMGADVRTKAIPNLLLFQQILGCACR